MKKPKAVPEEPKVSRSCSGCSFRIGRECRANPPFPMHLPDAAGAFLWRAVWPTVEPYDVCGRWDGAE